MRKYKFIFSVVLFALIILSSQLLFAQPCPDTSDQGNCDTLFVDKTPQGRIFPNSEFIVWVWGYHDEDLAGISIPLKYKNPQTDVTLDSIRYHPNLGSPLLKDTVRDNAAGTMVMFAVWSDSLAAGIDTFFTMYFTTGPSWDPSICLYIDTFTLPSGQGLSYSDTTTPNPHDIQPYVDIRACLDVKDDNRFPSTLRPTTFSLSQNFPNPFNTETVITFALSHTSNVQIEIFNVLGQKIRDLVDEKVSVGYKKIVWDGRDNKGSMVASGVYFYRIKAREFKDIKKMTLLK